MVVSGAPGSDAPPLGRAATVVGDGGYVANEGDAEPGRLKRAKRTLSTRSGTFDEHGDRTHPVLHRSAGGFFGGALRSERGRPARAL